MSGRNGRKGKYINWKKNKRINNDKKRKEVDMDEDRFVGKKLRGARRERVQGSGDEFLHHDGQFPRICGSREACGRGDGTNHRRVTGTSTMLVVMTDFDLQKISMRIFSTIFLELPMIYGEGWEE